MVSAFYYGSELKIVSVRAGHLLIHTAPSTPSSHVPPRFYAYSGYKWHTKQTAAHSKTIDFNPLTECVVAVCCDSVIDNTGIRERHQMEYMRTRIINFLSTVQIVISRRLSSSRPVESAKKRAKTIAAEEAEDTAVPAMRWLKLSQEGDVIFQRSSENETR